MNVRIIYEDKDILAVVKPSGIPAQPDKTGDPDLLTAAEEQTGQKLFLVHRLDRPVGGVLLLAKSAKAEAVLSKAMQAGEVSKTYAAVLCGVPEESEGIWEDYLYKNGRTNLSEVVPKERKGAKKAILQYRLLGTKEGLSLVEIRLMTGRHHQIRVQTSSRGLPIWGDRKYNSLRRTMSGEAIALWSCAMEGRMGNGKPFLARALPEGIPFSLFPEILEKM